MSGSTRRRHSEDDRLFGIGDGGAATSANLFLPYGVTVDSAGNLYIADTYNHSVRMVSGGVITTVLGIGQPEGVFVDSTGNLYIADASNNRIRAVNTGGSAIAIAGVVIGAGQIATVAGNGTAGFTGDGGAASDQLDGCTEEERGGREKREGAAGTEIEGSGCEWAASSSWREAASYSRLHGGPHGGIFGKHRMS